VAVYTIRIFEKLKHNQYAKVRGAEANHAGASGASASIVQFHAYYLSQVPQSQIESRIQCLMVS
jgi:hypothetical protein